MNTFEVALWGDASPLQVSIQSTLPEVTLDGQALAPEVVLHLVAYGFRQCIRDAAASEKDDALRVAAAQKKVSKLLAGEFGGGGGGPRLTPLEKAMRAVAQRIIRAQAEARGLTVTQGAIDKLVPSVIERHEDRVRELALKDLADAKQEEIETIDFAEVAKQVKADKK